MDGKIHLFESSIDINDLPARFNNPFDYIPHRLVKCAAVQVQDYVNSRYVMEEGKMFGVLVVKDANDKLGFLAAYSGIFGDNKDDYFVPPIFDLLDSAGFYLKDEALLNDINAEIRSLEKRCAEVKNDSTYIALQKHYKDEIENYKAFCADEKKRRDSLRAQGVEVDIKESQFQKAQLRRLKKEADEKYAPYLVSIQSYICRIEELKTKRAAFSSNVQEKIFRNFVVKSANGEERDLIEIFRETEQKTPPGGSGECAAPKLLQYAFSNNLKPICMGEFWWGPFEKTEIRYPGVFYPSCLGKCKPILGFMLKGMEIDTSKNAECSDYRVLYNDEYMIIVDKPSGVLSVPGARNDISMQSILERKFGVLYAVHRLDMDTSGIIIYAKSKDGQRRLQDMFRKGEVKKKYLAVVEGIVSNPQGDINLPIATDYINRPRQRVSHDEGKHCLTHYRVLEQTNQRALVAFTPVTGRTHQLRVHAAHTDGLNCPIVGDRLYGVNSGARLHLHACEIVLKHPISHLPMVVTSQKPKEFTL